MNHRSLLLRGVRYPRDDGCMTAGEYVSKNILRRFDHDYFFNKDDVIQWIDDEEDKANNRFRL